MENKAPLSRTNFTALLADVKLRIQTAQTHAQHGKAQSNVALILPMTAQGKGHKGQQPLLGEVPEVVCVPFMEAHAA